MFVFELVVVVAGKVTATPVKLVVAVVEGDEAGKGHVIEGGNRSSASC